MDFLAKKINDWKVGWQKGWVAKGFGGKRVWWQKGWVTTGLDGKGNCIMYSKKIEWRKG